LDRLFEFEREWEYTMKKNQAFVRKSISWLDWRF
jgi:hypothetical protein